MQNNNNLLMSVYIREADVSESKEISQVIINTLISSSAQYYSEHVINYMIGLCSEQSIREQFNNGIFICAYDQDKIVGCGCITETELKRFFILKDYQNKGIGTKMVKLLIQLHKDKFSLNHIHLYSTIPARHLYERAGFYIIEEINDEDRGHVYIMQYDH